MQFLNTLLLASALLLATLSNAAPTKSKVGVHSSPEPDMQVLLRETKKNSVNWHFAVAIRRAGNDQDTLYEYLIDPQSKTMVINSERQPSKSGAADFPISGPVLKAGEEKDWDAVARNIKSIISSQVPNYVPIPAKGEGSITNCFDFANMALGALHNAKYISDNTMASFTAYFNAHKDEVCSTTDDHTREQLTGSSSSNRRSRRP